MTALENGKKITDDDIAKHEDRLKELEKQMLEREVSEIKSQERFKVLEKRNYIGIDKTHLATLRKKHPGITSSSSNAK